MRRPKVQIQELIPGIDTEMSRLCDKFLEGRDRLKKERNNFQAVENALIQFMRTAGKKSIKHGGVTIRQVHQEEKDKIQVVTTN